jgi:hypothetical protein
MNRPFGIAAWVLAALSALGAPAATPVAPTLEQIRAASVRGIVQGKTVKLKDGKYEGAPFVRGGTERPTVALVERYSSTGNLDDTPAEERVVLLTQSSGGSGANLFLAVFGMRGGSVRNLATVLVGDRTQPSMLAIGGGMIFLDVVEAGPGDAACCPTQPARKTYRYGRHGLEPVTGVSSLPLPGRSAVSLSAVSEFRSTVRRPC